MAGYGPTGYGSGAGSYGGASHSSYSSSSVPIGGSHDRSTNRGAQDAGGARAPWRDSNSDNARRGHEDDFGRGGRAPDRGKGDNYRDSGSRGGHESFGKGGRAQDRAPDRGYGSRPNSDRGPDRPDRGSDRGHEPRPSASERYSDGKGGPPRPSFPRRDHEDGKGGYPPKLSGREDGKGGYPSKPSGPRRDYEDSAGRGYDRSYNDAPSRDAERALPPAGGRVHAITLSSCQHREISAIVSGRYEYDKENHGKAVYRRLAPSQEGVHPLVYYWDERDGANFSGWWIGPIVGGDQVWGHHSDGRGVAPPECGWKIPFDGSIDSTFTLTCESGHGVAHKSSAPRSGGDYPTSRSSGGYGDQRSRDSYGVDNFSSSRPASTDPRAGNYGSDPRADSYGSDPRAGSYGSDPRACSYGSDPRAGSHGSDPRASSYGSDPRVVAYGSDPRASSYGADPRAVSYGSDPRAGSYGSDPRAGSYGPEHRNRDSRPPPDDHYGPRPPSGYGSDPRSRDRDPHPSDPRGKGEDPRTRNRDPYPSDARGKGGDARTRDRDPHPSDVRGKGGDPRTRDRDPHPSDARGKGGDPRSRDGQGARHSQPPLGERHYGSYPAPAPNGAPIGASRFGDQQDRARPGMEDNRRYSGNDNRRAPDSERDRREGFDRRDPFERRDGYGRRDDRGNDRRPDDRSGGGKDDRYGGRDKRDDRQVDRRPPWDAERRRDDDRRRPGEDMRRREEIDRRGRDDERRRDEERRRTEELRKRRDQDRQQKIERMQRSEEQANTTRRIEEQKRAEQRAALEVRKSLQMLSFVRAENFELVKAGVYKIINEQSAALGSMRNEVMQQVDEAMKRAMEKISKAELDKKKFEDNLKHAKQQYAARLEDAAKKESEKEDAIKKQLEELTDLVFVAEAKTDLLYDVVENEFHTGDTVRQGELSLAVASVEECAAEAETGHKACLDFAQKNGLGGSLLSAENKTSLMQLVKRIGESGNRAQELLKKSRTSVNDILNNIVAKKVAQHHKDLFDKYDEDQTGTWTSSAFAKYGKEEFGMDVPLEVTDDIFQYCVHEGDTRIFMESFFTANAALGVASGNEHARKEREELNAAKEKEAAEKEARAALLEPERLKTEELIREVALLGESVEADVVEAEKLGQRITNTKEQAQLATADMREKIDIIADKVQAVKQRLEEVVEKVALVEAKGDFPELAEMKTEKGKKLRGACNFMRARTTKLSSVIASARTLLQKRTTADVPKTRAAIVEPLCAYMEKESLTREALFEKAGASETDGMSEEQWTALLDLCEVKDLTSEQTSTFFKKRADQESGKMSQEVFLQLAAVNYKVVQKTVLTDALSISEGKVLRKLAIGELLEALDAPTEEEATHLKRMRVKAKNDGMEGWASMASNLGTKYLEEGCICIYKAAGSSPLTKDKEATEVLRNIEDGEAVELLQHSVRHDESDEKKTYPILKVCSLNDGAIGWVLAADGDKVILKPI